MSEEELQEYYDQQQNAPPEENFDEATLELMKLIKDKTPEDCQAVIILKPADVEQPIVFSQGHPYEVTALAAQYVRSMKQTLLPELDT